jgi:hypothetical protein
MGNILYICDAEDTIGNERQPANMEQKVTLAGMTLEYNILHNSKIISPALQPSKVHVGALDDT